MSPLFYFVLSKPIHAFLQGFDSFGSVSASFQTEPLCAVLHIKPHSAVRDFRE